MTLNDTMPTALLHEEHGHIKRVLEILARFVAAAAGSPAVHPEKQTLLRIVAVLKGFADGHHHAKEEKILFEYLIRQGFIAQEGPIAVLSHDHNLGRALMQRMEDVGRTIDGWSADQLSELQDAGWSYISLMKDHITKEDFVLFPMASRILPAAELANLSRDFREFEMANAEARSAFMKEIDALGALLPASAENRAVPR